MSHSVEDDATAELLVLRLISGSLCESSRLCNSQNALAAEHSISGNNDNTLINVLQATVTYNV